MITQILLQQTIIMFLLMMLGLLLSRRGMITEQGSRDLSNVLLYAVIPCVILRSYMSEFSMDKLRAMGISAVIAVIAFIASIGVAYLTCGTRHRIENFAVAFGNAGNHSAHKVCRKKSGHAPDFLHPDSAPVGRVIGVLTSGFYGTAGHI